MGTGMSTMTIRMGGKVVGSLRVVQTPTGPCYVATGIATSILVRVAREREEAQRDLMAIDTTAEPAL